MRPYQHQEAEGKLIRFAHIRFDALFSEGQQSYSDERWDISQHLRATYNQRKRFIPFRHYWLNKDPLPDPLGDLVKAYLLAKDRLSPDAMQNQIGSVRIFCDVVVQKYGSDLVGFNWQTIDDDFLTKTEAYATPHCSQGALYAHMKTILAFLRFLADNGIGHRPTYVTRVQRPEHARRRIYEVHNEDGMLPTQAALMGLADVYHNPQSDQDKLMSSIIALTLAGGFRIGETMSLNTKCLVKGTEGHIGIRYYEEKSKNGRNATQTRWITPEFMPLVKDAMNRILAITKEFRKQARLLEAHPDTIPIPEWEGKEIVRRKDIQKLWGMHNIYTIPTKEVPRYHDDQGGVYFKVDDLKRWLHARRGPLLTLHRTDGTSQKLSETLLIASRFYFRPNSNTLHHVIEQIQYGQIRYFLGSGQGKSIFERYDIREPDGTHSRMSSHQLRRWTTDTANKGGLSIHQLNMWMKRQDPQHVHHYLKSTLDERREQLPKDIEAGNAYGPLVDLHNEAPATAKSLLDHGNIGSIYVTPFGLCVHDLYSAPCEYHMTCLRGCPDYLLVKGDPDTLQNLLDLQNALEQTIRLNQEAYQQHSHPSLLARIEQDQETLLGVRKALHFLTNDTIPDGTQVNPNTVMLVDEISTSTTGEEPSTTERTIR